MKTVIEARIALGSAAGSGRRIGVFAAGALLLGAVTLGGTAAAEAQAPAQSLPHSPAQAAPGGNPNYSPPPAKEGFSYPDCYCTGSTGERVEIGQMTCLSIGSRQVLARCEMSVNNPIWRHQGEGCPGV